MKREEIQKEVDRFNRQFHKRLTVDEYLKFTKKVLTSSIDAQDSNEAEDVYP